MEARLSTAGGRDQATVAVGVSAAREHDRAAAVFVGVRPRLFDVAYRILASASEAEDVVQEAWLRWQRTDRSVVLNPTAFLATTTTRLALNLAQSARSRRETCADPCILDPADPGIGPETQAERGEAVEGAVLLLLEKLTPPERAAYVLREAFDYPYRRIAEILLLTSAHARQLVRRAHKRIASERRRSVTPSAHCRLVAAFRAASHAGQLSELEQVLVADVASYTERTAGEAHPYPLRQSSGQEQTWRPTRISLISSHA